MVLTMEGRSRTSTRLAVLLASLLVAGASAGCSSDSGGTDPATTPPPGGTTSSVASTGPSTSPSLAAPVLPEAAKQPTRPGAEAFFRYFIDVYSYAFTSQDTTGLRQVSAPECKFCSSTVDAVESARADQEHTTGGDLTPSLVTAASGEPAEGLVVNAVVDQAASQLVDQSGKVIQTEPAYPQVRMDASVRWLNGSWQMRALHVFPRPSK
jgi:hypothetical protein